MENNKCTWACDHNQCEILINRNDCSIEKCAFYITSDQLLKKKAKINKRLRSLPTEQQEEIANKYYNDMMPWYDEDCNNEC